MSCVIIWGNSLSWVVYNMQCSNSLSCSVWYFELSFSPLIESWSNLSEESAKPQQPVVSSGKLTTHNFLFINSYWNCVEIDIKFFFLISICILPTTWDIYHDQQKLRGWYTTNIIVIYLCKMLRSFIFLKPLVKASPP